MKGEISMNKTIKRNVIVSAILAIALCTSLMVGATFALFTSESKVNIAITSGKVDVVANIDETSVYTKSLTDADYIEGADHMYEATADFGMDGGLELKYMVPGDAIKFNIIVKNNSNVTVKYRTLIACEDNGLLSGLNITIDGNEYHGTTDVSAYETLAVGAPDKTIAVSVELPENAGNEYREKTMKLFYTVEAVQGNKEVSNPAANTTYVYNVNDFLNFKPTDRGKTYKVEIVNDIDMTRWTNPLNIDYISVEIEGNGHKLSNMKAALFSASSNNTLTVENVIIDNASIGDDKSNSSAAIVNYVNSNGGGNIVLNNCHVTNSEIRAYQWAGAFIGAEADCHGVFTLNNCSVKDTTVTTVDSSAGAFFGYVMSEITLNNCKVLGTTAVKCNENRNGSAAKAGAFVGTVGIGSTGLQTTHFNGCTVVDTVVVTNFNAKAPVVNGFVGRLAAGQVEIDGGKWIADGVILKDDVYEISSANGMFWMSEQVESNNYFFNNKTVKLTADIDLENRAWTPMGQSDAMFTGTFDGNGYTIKNLSVTEGAGYLEWDAVGLFGWIGENSSGMGYVKNVKIDGAVVNGHSYVGAVAGYVQFGSVEDCTVLNAKVIGTHLDNARCGDKVGAVVGFLAPNSYATVKNCKAEKCEVKAARDAGQVIGCVYSAHKNYSGLSATEVTVTATNGCTHGSAGSNINEAPVGRDATLG